MTQATTQAIFSPSLAFDELGDVAPVFDCIKLLSQRRMLIRGLERRIRMALNQRRGQERIGDVCRSQRQRGIISKEEYIAHYKTIEDKIDAIDAEIVFNRLLLKQIVSTWTA